jgi:hypothetical protein
MFMVADGSFRRRQEPGRVNRCNTAGLTLAQRERCRMQPSMAALMKGKGEHDLALELDAIPDELTELKQWGFWGTTAEKGKVSILPDVEVSQRRCDRRRAGLPGEATIRRTGLPSGSRPGQMPRSMSSEFNRSASRCPVARHHRVVRGSGPSPP